jgi:hypothetical protein
LIGLFSREHQQEMERDERVVQAVLYPPEEGPSSWQVVFSIQASAFL